MKTQEARQKTYRSSFYCATCRYWIPKSCYSGRRKEYRCPLCHGQVRRSPRKKHYELPRVNLPYEE